MDNKLAVPSGVGPLAPGDDVTVTATHTINQADLDAGSITNTATAATTHEGSSVTSNQDSVTVTANAEPWIALIKTGLLDMTVVAPTDKANVGDKITYAFTVTNTGDVTLTGVTVTDPKVTVSGGPISLAPGATDTTTFTATYTLTPTDIEAGLVENQALATGTPPVGGPVTDLSDLTTTVTSKTTKRLSISRQSL